MTFNVRTEKEYDIPFTKVKVKFNLTGPHFDEMSYSVLERELFNIL